MSMKVEVLGVHPLSAAEPVHLIEIVVSNDIADFDFGAVTQEDATQPQENWQVAYEEQLLSESTEDTRYAFFFHFLNLGKPLLTPNGQANLPPPTPVPEHLLHIHYEPP
jgi:hypothetical protein